MRKLVISLTLVHKKGSLSKLCDRLAKMDISILTVFQSDPIDDVAPVMLSLDISNMKTSINDFKKKLTELPEIGQLRIMSFEK